MRPRSSHRSRGRLVVAALALSAVGLSVQAVGTTATGAATPQTRVIADCRHRVPVIRPADFVLICDPAAGSHNNAYLKSVKYESWNSTRAGGTGTYYWHDPNLGRDVRERATFVLLNVRNTSEYGPLFYQLHIEGESGVRSDYPLPLRSQPGPSPRPSPTPTPTPDPTPTPTPEPSATPTESTPAPSSTTSPSPSDQLPPRPTLSQSSSDGSVTLTVGVDPKFSGRSVIFYVRSGMSGRVRPLGSSAVGSTGFAYRHIQLKQGQVLALYSKLLQTQPSEIANLYSNDVTFKVR